jgi:DNA-binding transcriptional LysR family regulator
MSQPALSKDLKSLQENYRVTLFTRTSKGIELTGEGMEFLRYIEPILEQLEMIDARFLTSGPEKISAPLRVGGTYVLSSRVLPSLLAVFKKRYPRVEIVLRSNSAAVLEPMILKSHLELALTSILPRSPELAAEFCFALKMVLFAAKGDPILQRKGLSLTDLDRIPLIIRDDGNRRGTTETLLQQRKAMGYHPNIVMRCESPEAIMTAVSKRLGVGILYEDVLKEPSARGSFKQVRISGLSMEGKIYIIYHKGRPLTSSAEAFLALVRERCATKTAKVRAGKASAVPA